MGWLKQLRGIRRTVGSTAPPARSTAVRQHGAPVITGAIPAHLAAPIAGVDLAQYARISAGLDERGYDRAAGTEVAARAGIDPIRWQTAVIGWNERIATHPEVARQFTLQYTGRAA